MPSSFVGRRELLLASLPLAHLFWAGCGGQPAARPVVAPPGAPPVTAPPGLALKTFAGFGVDETLIREGLAAALAKGAERADLFFEHKVATYVTLEDGEVNRAYTSVDLGVGVRAVRGDQTGYGYTEELTVDALRRAGATAASVASGPSRAVPPALRVADLPSRYRVKVPWDSLPSDQRLSLLTRVNDRIRSADKRITAVRVSFTNELRTILLVDSDGRVFEDVLPNTALGASCTAEVKGRRESNGYDLASPAGMELYTDERIDRLVREAVARTLVLFETKPAPLGEMPVVLTGGLSGLFLHEAIGHGMEADFNRKNTSIYADRIGKPVAKDLVTIVDDGTIDSDRGAKNVDDEGNAPQKTVLVDKGTLATYLHDSISAKHYDVKPTGNGRRESFRHVPMPRMRATYMLPGPHADEEIIRSVKKGIYCSNFANGQVQIGAGDFTFYVKNGYLIEDGKLTRPITDVNLIGNGPKALEKVDMVGQKLEFYEGGGWCGKNGQTLYVSFGLPTIRIASLTVGGRSA